MALAGHVKEGGTTYRILGIRHGIEWTKRHRKLINDEIISFISSSDNAAKSFLICSAVGALINNSLTRWAGLTQYHLALLLKRRLQLGGPQLL